MNKYRMNAIVTARRLLQFDPLFLDTETTGLDEAAEVVDVALIKNNGETLVSTLVRPGSPIPAEATAVHGITDEMCAGALRFDEVWDTDLKRFVTGERLFKQQTICVYNAAYDWRVMKQSLKQYGVPAVGFCQPFCVMELYAEFYGQWNDYHQSFTWQKLSDAARQCQLKIPANLHRAHADAELTRQVLQHMARQII